jgi:hypothetical protein
MRYFSDHSLPTRPPAVAAGKVGDNPGLVDEDQFRRVQRGLTNAPCSTRLGNIGPILFGGVLELFFV